MIATKLFDDVYDVPSIEISGLSENSKTVKKGDIFFAINGKNVDGKKYITEAIENGASLVVTNTDIVAEVPVVVVDNVRKVMGEVCAKYFTRPKKLIAVVGSSGKTSTCYILKEILDKKYKCGFIGTTGAYIDDTCLYYGLTTPDTIDLHIILDKMNRANVDVVVMEMSAQAITLYKMCGLMFDIAIFTNITPEHLDYFQNMENYIATKFSFFDKKYAKECIVNVDDISGQTLARNVKLPTITYGIFSPSNTFAIDIMYARERTSFVANVLDTIMYIDTNLIGEYNIYNILASVTAGKMLGVEIEDMVEALVSIKMKGRNEVYSYRGGKVVLDFAHTVDSVDKILSMYRHTTSGRLMVCIGCTGYSDTNKRINMGQVLDKYADIVYLCPDNPDKVDVNTINKDISQSIIHSKVYNFSDRMFAIAQCMDTLRPNDTLMILGKAGENYQKVSGKNIEYSDKSVVERVIEGENIETGTN